VQEWRRDGYVISTDPARIDVDVVHGYLTRSYWAGGISRDVVARSVAGALNFGIYLDAAQVGGARIITDYATFAYLADVFVLEDHRGGGLGVWLLECVVSHPSLQGFRRWMLGTRDAHGLYEKTGWTRIAPDDDRWMQRYDGDVYKR
jgi:GNAT superfamily N-acetyltransferase